MDKPNSHNKKAQKLVVAILIVLSYLIFTKIGQELSFKSFTAITFWLSGGLSLAIMLIYGRRIWPVIFAGFFISQLLLSPFPFEISNIVFILSNSIGNVVEAYTGLLLYRHYIQKANFLTHVRMSFIFMSIAIGVAFVGALFVMISRALIYKIPSDIYLVIFFKWWMGDFLGVLIVTPFLYSIFKDRRLNYPLLGLAEISSLFTLVIIFSQYVFGPFVDSQIIYSIPLLVIPLLMWIAYRFSPRETSIAVFIIAVAAIFGTINGYGPFVYSNTNVSLLLLQLYLGVIAMLALVQSASVEERKMTQKEAAKLHESLERRVMKRTMELATINKELLVEVNQRKKVEKALKESEDRLRFIFENANDAIFTLNQDGEFVYTSPVVSKLFGHNGEYFHSHSFLELIDVKDKAEVEKSIGEVFNNKISQVTVNYRVEIEPGDYCWHSTSITRTQTAVGKVVYIAVAKDETERILAEEERKKLEEQFQHSQKLESLGVLAGGIAHDFNNLLTAIMGNCGLAMINVPEESKAVGNLHKIEKASIRAADLCQQLLAYSGKGKFIVGPLQINDIVREMSNLLSVSISRKVKLEFNFMEDIKCFDGDASQIRQIVMNIITNASEAIGDLRGVIKITTNIVNLTRDDFNGYYMADDIEDGDYICLDVSDNGAGMDKKTKAKIFEPFFTTKFTGRGLGLAAVLGIVRSHNGALRIDSSPDKGTTFRIIFPVSKKNTRPIKENPVSETKWTGNGLILVVDDEADIRDLGRATLEQAGLKVVTADDGLDAINVYKKYDGKIKLVLMDMTMPNLNGEETYKELCKMHPDVKVILSSGYSEQEATKKFSDSGLCGFLQKPYKPSDLLRKVKNIID